MSAYTKFKIKQKVNIKIKVIKVYNNEAGREAGREIPWTLFHSRAPIRLFMRTRNFLVLCYVVKYKILGLLILSGPSLRELLRFCKCNYSKLKHP